MVFPCLSTDGKTFKKPRRPFEKERLDAELKLVGEYGLRNKRELWRVQAVLSKIRNAARMLLTLEDKDPKRVFEGNALMRRMNRYGLLSESQDKLDYVLALTPQVRPGSAGGLCVCPPHAGLVIRGACCAHGGPGRERAAHVRRPALFQRAATAEPPRSLCAVCAHVWCAAWLRWAWVLATHMPQQGGARGRRPTRQLNVHTTAPVGTALQCGPGPFRRAGLPGAPPADPGLQAGPGKVDSPRTRADPPAPHPVGTTYARAVEWALCARAVA